MTEPKYKPIGQLLEVAPHVYAQISVKQRGNHAPSDQPNIIRVDIMAKPDETIEHIAQNVHGKIAFEKIRARLKELGFNADIPAPMTDEAVLTAGDRFVPLSVLTIKIPHGIPLPLIIPALGKALDQNGNMFLYSDDQLDSGKNMPLTIAELHQQIRAEHDGLDVFATGANRATPSYYPKTTTYSGRGPGQF